MARSPGPRRTASTRRRPRRPDHPGAARSPCARPRARPGTIEERRDQPEHGDVALAGGRQDRSATRRRRTSRRTSRRSTACRVRTTGSASSTTPDTLNSAEPVVSRASRSQCDQTLLPDHRVHVVCGPRSSTSMVNELRGGWQWSPVQLLRSTKCRACSNNQDGLQHEPGLRADQCRAGALRATRREARNTANWTVADHVHLAEGIAHA